MKYECAVFFLFFFSSRRRHTRSKRDWSSDVCSSDLIRSSVPSSRVRRGHGVTLMRSKATSAAVCDATWLSTPLLWMTKSRRGMRSEERRVGKECRCRGWPGQGDEKRYGREGGGGE